MIASTVPARRPCRKSCANGGTPVTSCSGQPALGTADVRLVPADDLQPGQHGRAAQRHARRDMIRFGGANQDILWNAFAKRGLGEGVL